MADVHGRRLNLAISAWLHSIPDMCCSAILNQQYTSSGKVMMLCQSKQDCSGHMQPAATLQWQMLTKTVNGKLKSDACCMCMLMLSGLVDK